MPNTLTETDFTLNETTGFHHWQADPTGSERANFSLHGEGAIKRMCWQAYHGNLSACASVDTPEEAIAAINAALPILRDADAKLRVTLP